MYLSLGMALIQSTAIHCKLILKMTDTFRDWTDIEIHWKKIIGTADDKISASALDRCPMFSEMCKTNFICWKWSMGISQSLSNLHIYY